ncbi:MAG: hypothetical protein ACFB00_08795 [Parvularculaceae bacterium]
MPNVLASEIKNGANGFSADVEVVSYRLKQTGGRPRQFAGVEICSAMSYVVGPPLWYEINVYQTTEDAFVVEIRMFTKNENERDLFRVIDAVSLEDVFETLETYDPAQDVDASVLRFADDDANVAELSVSAAALRLRVEEARRQFRDLVGDILYQIESA